MPAVVKAAGVSRSPHGGGNDCVASGIGLATARPISRLVGPWDSCHGPRGGRGGGAGMLTGDVASVGDVAASGAVDGLLVVAALRTADPMPSP
ncbi:hypothetical protein B1T49_26060 [Mycobacterium persicum]|nr:hypothetical protein B1T49_26060 [Mycobacterium persicum]